MLMELAGLILCMSSQIIRRVVNYLWGWGSLLGYLTIGPARVGKKWKLRGLTTQDLQFCLVFTWFRVKCLSWIIISLTVLSDRWKVRQVLSRACWFTLDSYTQNITASICVRKSSLQHLKSNPANKSICVYGWHLSTSCSRPTCEITLLTAVYNYYNDVPQIYSQLYWLPDLSLLQVDKATFTEHILPQLREDLSAGWEGCTPDRLLLALTAASKVRPHECHGNRVQEHKQPFSHNCIKLYFIRHSVWKSLSGYSSIMQCDSQVLFYYFTKNFSYDNC